MVTFSIEKSIPALPNGSIQLHLEFTRLDSARVGSVSRLETFHAVKDANVLAGSNRMSVSMSELSYKVATWKVYTLRLRLEAEGVVSQEWSPYSARLCISCDDCKSLIYLGMCCVYCVGEVGKRVRKEGREREEGKVSEGMSEGRREMCVCTFTCCWSIAS